MVVIENVDCLPQNMGVYVYEGPLVLDLQSTFVNPQNIIIDTPTGTGTLCSACVALIVLILNQPFPADVNNKQ